MKAVPLTVVEALFLSAGGQGQGQGCRRAMSIVHATDLVLVRGDEEEPAGPR